jgi:aspartate/tyrosine/aromatic aminotransferase
LTSAYANDKDVKKVNLGVGAYRTDAGVPYVFNCVRKAEKEIANDPKMFKVLKNISSLSGICPY